MTDPLRGATDTPITTAPTRRRSALNALWLIVPVLVILYVARGVLGPFVIAIAIAYAFTPVVDNIAERAPIRRSLVVLITFLVALLILGVLAALAVGPLSREVQLLSSQGPTALANQLRSVVGSDSIRIGNSEISVADLAAQAQAGLSGLLRSPEQAVHVAAVAAEVSLQTLLTIILTFYMLLDGYRFRDFMLRFFPPDQRGRVGAIGSRIHVVLGQWLRGQVLLVGLVSSVTYVALGPVLHVPGALALGIMTGILEIIPLIGPYTATAVAAVVAFAAGGPGLAIEVVIVYVVIRQVEDQVVMPVVIGRAVHLHPAATIFAVLLGLHLAGILGGLLAVPVAAALNVVFKEVQPMLYPDDPALLEEAHDDATPAGPPPALPAEA